jgi:hypothetical protein
MVWLGLAFETEGDRPVFERERLTGEVVEDGEVSERFFGRPRSMIEAPDSDSCLRCE